jgi:hypothetical protein
VGSGRPVPDEPSAGTALFRIDSFALSANNVTYATLGDEVGYWRFFPTTDAGWGRVPVWGYADVVASACDGVLPGERVFGLWPMSTHALLQPDRVGPNGFNDGAPHRGDLPPIYNRYQRAPTGADPDAEARTALLRPLFALSFLVDDWLGEQDVFGATAVVLSSASSKTALGIAHLLTANRRAEVVGLTSPRNVEFVAATGVYDRIVPYDELPDGLGDVDAVLVDMAGDPDVLAAVHRHFGDRLRRSVRVGYTHHDSPADAVRGLPGPSPELFFAPDHIQRRSADWGGAGFAERLDAARQDFDEGVGATLAIERHHGVEAVRQAWTAVVDGTTDPARGIICSW